MTASAPWCAPPPPLIPRPRALPSNNPSAFFFIIEAKRPPFLSDPPGSQYEGDRNAFDPRKPSGRKQKPREVEQDEEALRLGILVLDIHKAMSLAFVYLCIGVDKAGALPGKARRARGPGGGLGLTPPRSSVCLCLLPAWRSLPALPDPFCRSRRCLSTTSSRGSGSGSGKRRRRLPPSLP